MTGGTDLPALLRAARDRLAAAGIESPDADVRFLAAHVFGRDRPLRDLDADRLALFQELLHRRAAREPLQRVLGGWEFWGLDLLLGPDTLIPRPDTETVISALLRFRPDRTARLRLLDLGTGTGALLLAALAEYRQAVGIGVDRAFGAAAVARTNADRLGLAGRAAFLVGDWGTALAGGFDVAMANPPYIPTNEIAGLAPEVALHEPRLALDGGDDGLECYRRIAAMLAELVVPGGLVLLEHGAGQDAAVAEILGAAGACAVAAMPDLEGRPRVAIAEFPPAADEG